MKISCEVIRDLLALYHDGICSNESKSLVEEHLKECKTCQSELDMMDSELDLVNTRENLDEAKELENLSKKWRLDKLKSFLTGTLMTIVIIIVIALVLSVFAEIRIV